jgi:hypothetical protein
LALGAAETRGLPHSLVPCFPLLHTTDPISSTAPLASPASPQKLTLWNTLAFDRWTSQIEPCGASSPSLAPACSPHKVKNARKYTLYLDSTHKRYQENLVADEYHR